jgi:hypothetical protein
MNHSNVSSDSAYFELVLTAMDASKGSNSFTIPEPEYYPTQPATLPFDIPVFNLVDPIFNFHVALSPSSKTTTSEPKSESLDTSNKPCKQEEVAFMLPEIGTFMAFDSDFNPMSSRPSTSLTPDFESEPLVIPSQQEEVVPKPRQQRAALGLHYSKFKHRLEILMQDPLVQDIKVIENKVQCSACKRDIQLDNRRRGSLHLQNWNTHKRRCVGIKADVSLRALCLRRSTVSDSLIFLRRMYLIEGASTFPSCNRSRANWWHVMMRQRILCHTVMTYLLRLLR